MLTNCTSCAKEINTDIHPQTEDGFLCFDCHFDYTIAKGGFDKHYL